MTELRRRMDEDMIVRGLPIGRARATCGRSPAWLGTIADRRTGFRMPRCRRISGIYCRSADGPGVPATSWSHAERWGALSG
jgi:hypothetical protein